MPESIDRRYQLIEPLENGGRGQVYLADIDGHRVVVKHFEHFEEFSDPEAQGSWNATCESLIELKHGALAATLDFGFDTENHVRFLVQEYVHGLSLVGFRQQLARPLAEVEAATLLIPIVDALMACERRGLTHGRIAPDHVLITPGIHATARLVGMRPHGSDFWPGLVDDDPAKSSDPAHSDALGLLAIVSFLTHGTGGAGVRVTPESVLSAPEGIASSLVHNGAAPSLEAVRAVFKRIVDADRQSSQSIGAMADKLAPTHVPVMTREMALLRESIRAPMLLTVPAQMAFRHHDGMARVLAVCAIIAVAIAGVAYFAGGTHPG